MNGLIEKKRNYLVSAAALCAVLFFAASANAAPRDGWRKHDRLDNKIRNLEARKEAIEVLQDRADDKVGGRRAEVIKARLEREQDQIDYKIKRIERRQDRVGNRYRPRYHPRGSSNYYNKRPLNVNYRPRNYSPRNDYRYRARCENTRGVGGYLRRY